jgi:hypothetical protein
VNFSPGSNFHRNGSAEWQVEAARAINKKCSGRVMCVDMGTPEIKDPAQS